MLGPGELRDPARPFDQPLVMQHAVVNSDLGLRPTGEFRRPGWSDVDLPERLARPRLVRVAARTDDEMDPNRPSSFSAEQVPQDLLVDRILEGAAEARDSFADDTGLAHAWHPPVKFRACFGVMFVSSEAKPCVLARMCIAWALTGLALAGCGSDKEPVEAARTVSAETVKAPAVPRAVTTAAPAETETRTAPKRQRERRDREARTAPSNADTTAAPATAPGPRPPAKTAEQTVPDAARKTTTPSAKPERPAKTITSKEHTPQGRVIEEVASLQLVRREGLTFFQAGEVAGTLNGQMTLEARLGGQGVQATFTVTVPDGSLVGAGEARVKLGGNVVKFSGSASIAQGTGAYAGATASELRFSGVTAADGSTATIKLAGRLLEP